MEISEPSEVSTFVVELSSEIPRLSFFDKLPWSNYFYAKKFCYTELSFPTARLLTILIFLTNLKLN